MSHQFMSFILNSEALVCQCSRKHQGTSHVVSHLLNPSKNLSQSDTNSPHYNGVDLDIRNRNNLWPHIERFNPDGGANKDFSDQASCLRSFILGRLKMSPHQRI